MPAGPPETPRASATPTEPASDHADGKAPPGPAAADFGPNQWLVDELYQRYLADPGSVDQAWWNFFADYEPQPADEAAARPAAAAQRGPARPAPAAQATPAGPAQATPAAPAQALAGPGPAS